MSKNVTLLFQICLYFLTFSTKSEIDYFHQAYCPKRGASHHKFHRFLSKRKDFWVTCVEQLRSIFHPLPKLNTYFQGSKFSSFFPSSAFCISQYLIYFTTALLPWKLASLSCERTGTRHRKGTSNITPEAFVFTVLQGHSTLFSPTLQRSTLFPTLISLLPAMFLLLYKSWWAVDIDPGSMSWLFQPQSTMPGRNTAASQGSVP